MKRYIKEIMICLCMVLGLVLLAGSAAAGPTSVAPASAQPTLAPYDDFVFAAPVTSSVQVGCTSCGIIDACLDKHPNERCKPTDPACRCKTCNGYFECYK